MSDPAAEKRFQPAPHDQRAGWLIRHGRAAPLRRVVRLAVALLSLAVAGICVVIAVSGRGGAPAWVLVSAAAVLFAAGVAAALSPSWRRRRAAAGGATGQGHRWRVHNRDLPHGTYVRDAVVLACPDGPDGDAAVRFAAREAELRGARLVVIASYLAPVDPDLESIETPQAELRRRARTRAETSLARALGRAVTDLPPHDIVTEPGPAAHVLLRDYADAQLLVVADPRPGLLGLVGGTQVGGAALLRRSRSPVALVPSDRMPALDGSHERIP